MGIPRSANCCAMNRSGRYEQTSSQPKGGTITMPGRPRFSRATSRCPSSECLPDRNQWWVVLMPVFSTGTRMRPSAFSAVTNHVCRFGADFGWD